MIMLLCGYFKYAFLCIYISTLANLYHLFQSYFLHFHFRLNKHYTGRRGQSGVESKTRDIEGLYLISSMLNQFKFSAAEDTCAEFTLAGISCQLKQPRMQENDMRAWKCTLIILNTDFC